MANTVPTNPENLVVISQTHNAVSFSWDVVTDATSYTIYKNGSYQTSVAAPDHSVTISGLVTGTLYDFAVSAVNAVGESGQTKLILTYNMNLNTAVTPGTGDLTLTWDAPRGQHNLSSPITNVAVGVAFALFVKANTTVTGWGTTTSPCAVPPDLIDVVDVKAGSAAYDSLNNYTGTHSIALKSDGTVVTWGDTIEPVPTGLKASYISAGYTSYAAIDDTNNIVIWSLASNYPTPSELTNSAIKVSVGDKWYVGLRSDNNVYCWGDDSGYNRVSGFPTGLTGVGDIKAGRYHGAAIYLNGTITCWGYNSDGQINPPGVLTDGSKKVIQIACGDNHTVALTDNSEIYAWGLNNYGQCDVPAALVGATDIIKIDAIFNFNIALRSNGEVYLWGNISNGMTDTSTIPGYNKFNIYQDNVLIKSTPITDFTTDITGLTNGNYNFHVEAVDNTTEIGKTFDETATILLVPDAPTNLSIINDATDSFTLTWDTVPMTDTYQVYKDGIAYGSPQAETSIDVTGLAPATSYTMTVTATNSAGTSAQSTELIHTTKLEQPTNITVDTITSEGFTVTWDIVADATSYKVYVDGNLVNEPTSNSSIITGLNANTTYNITIKAIGPNSESDFSIGVDATTLISIPDAPTNLSITNNMTDSFMLNWGASATATSYQVYKDGTAYGNPVTDTSLSITGLTSNTSYTMTVSAINSTGESTQSNSLDVLTLPDVPINLISSNVSFTTATLTWDAPASGADNYQVYKDGIPYGNPQIETSIDITDLIWETSYDFVVKAINNSGESNNSAIKTITTLPANFSLNTTLTQNDITLEWNIPTTINITSFNVVQNQNIIANVSNTTTNYNIQNLSPNNYSFYIEALDNTTPTGYTNIKNINISLIAPENIVISNITATSCFIEWDNALGATSYEVYVDGNLVDEPTTNLSNITGLFSGNTYNITIKSVNATTTSIASPITTLQTLSAVLSELNVVYDNGTNTITLSWADEGAEQYQISYKTDYADGYTGTGLTLDETGTQPADSPFTVTGTNVVLHNAIVDTPYWFAIQAMNGGIWDTIVENSTNVTPTVSGAANTGLPAPSDVTMTINQSTKEITLNWIQE